MKQLIGSRDEGGGFFSITRHVTPEKGQRGSTPSHQRTVKAPPVAERRSSSNWEMKIFFFKVASSSSGWLRGVYLVPPRVTRMWAGYPFRPPGRHPERSTFIFKFPTFRCWKSVFKTKAERPISQRHVSEGVVARLPRGLSRRVTSGACRGRTALEGQRVADLQLVFLGQRCAPMRERSG
ncbi:hypothetical protein NPIL_544621 [Nephila pilipes]|uniref:Uncharacterized protein n=1 Tax=Nephila pilipes TaxID=299642 RepID=A0A8X6U1S3_NEPPI|nr:hypothetical protein NPIL_544621 [Nephila pilipes]